MTWNGSSTAFDVQFTEAVGWFRSRIPMTDDEYNKLELNARRRAFTVSGVANLDLVDTTMSEIQKALELGTGLAEFKTAVSDKLRAAWGDKATRSAGYRMETIFRTNIQQAYGAGRYDQLTNPDVLAARPFWMYDAIMDSRTSGICSSLNGTVRPADDDWWNGHIPPLHHMCRSGLRSLTRSGAEARGITQNPPSITASDGFGQRPGVEEWEPDWSKYDPETLQTYRTKLREQLAITTPELRAVPRARRQTLERLRRVTRDSGVEAEISAMARQVLTRGRYTVATTWDETVFLLSDDNFYDDLPNGMMNAFQDGFLSSDNVDHIAFHEVGHAIWNRSDKARAVREGRRRVTASLAEMVSARAKRNISEFIGEVYAGLRSGRTFPDRVLEKYAELGGPTP
jgi:SPP1 gp7 family putative phage head morphogenesis protein